ncbi:MAG TPA: MarR family transcriptional regulator [Actinomycetaceae bacterium]|nr:MarR family transcriptional regulator [Actinomycetaceae bacterium]
MEPHGSVVYTIKQLELGLRPRFMAACAAGGLTGAQYTALTVLQLRPGITSSELARRSFVRAQTMAATVTSLIAAGYVRREEDPEHRRRMLLYLTTAGAEAIAKLAPAIGELEEMLFVEFTPEERAELGNYLRRLRRALNGAGHRVAPDAQE